MTKARGRPREFDPQLALQKAMPLFWQKGLSATSLDDLSSAMAMNRPSIYNAFGNKEAIYRKVLAQFCGQLSMAIESALSQTPDIKQGLMKFYDLAVDLYCGTDPSLGCLMMCTAPVETAAHPEVRKDLETLISTVDDRLQQHLQYAAQKGALKRGLDTELTAQLLQAVLHSLALRARAGEADANLREFARFSVQTILQQ